MKNKRDPFLLRVDTDADGWKKGKNAGNSPFCINIAHTWNNWDFEHSHKEKGEKIQFRCWAVLITAFFQVSFFHFRRQIPDGDFFLPSSERKFEERK